MDKVWKPYNVKAIVNNVKLVFRTGDIEKLNGTAYRFIILYMGFIAHYDIYGFKAAYSKRPGLLARNLLMSEGYSNDLNYNYKAARQHLEGRWREQGGMIYQKSVGETMLGILAAANDFLQR